ncbi:hypothetical protein [Clostridium cochlearium]|nr:hypothetical protein [Clostridium cochlearium]
MLEKRRPKIGQIRIEIYDFKALIGHSIDKNYRRKGYGFAIL